MTTKLTPWMSVATPPLRSRPGFYDVRFNLYRFCHVERREWTGRRWARGGLNPSSIWCDTWRGIAKG
jgi:hypothetical protein